MSYYIQGNAANADKISAAFKAKAIYNNLNFANENYLYYSCDGKVAFCFIGGGLANIIKTHPDYKELELPVEPKFKAEDRIVNKIDKSTVYRIIALHEELRKYIVDIEHKDHYESCPWIAFEDQDDYELAPKQHYDISNFHAGMPVLVRADNVCRWNYSVFSNITGNKDWQFAVCNGVSFTQCIPFKGNEHLLGTTDPCDEQYINW